MTLALAFDTATEHTVIALGRIKDGGAPEVLASIDIHAPRAAMSITLPTVSEMLARCGIDVSALEAILVGRGPGSFTGVRIGIATAKGIAQGLGVPLYGIPTTDAIAGRFAATPGIVGVVGDAMRSEVYPVRYRCDGEHAIRLDAFTVREPQGIAAEWAIDDHEHTAEGVLSAPMVLAGNGLEKYEDIFMDALGRRALVAPLEQWPPDGASLLRSFARMVRDGEVGAGDPAEVLPIYTRLSDAEEAEASRAGTTTPRPPSGVVGPAEPGKRR